MNTCRKELLFPSEKAVFGAFFAPVADACTGYFLFVNHSDIISAVYLKLRNSWHWIVNRDLVVDVDRPIFYGSANMPLQVCAFSCNTLAEALSYLSIAAESRNKSMATLYDRLNDSPFNSSISFFSEREYGEVVDSLTQDIFASKSCPSWANYARADDFGRIIFDEDIHSQALGFTSDIMCLRSNTSIVRDTTPEYTMEELVDKLGHDFKIKKGD